MIIPEGLSEREFLNKGYMEEERKAKTKVVWLRAFLGLSGTCLILAYIIIGICFLIYDGMWLIVFALGTYTFFHFYLIKVFKIAIYELKDCKNPLLTLDEFELSKPDCVFTNEMIRKFPRPAQTFITRVIRDILQNEMLTIGDIEAIRADNIERGFMIRFYHLSDIEYDALDFAVAEKIWHAMVSNANLLK